MQIHRGIPRSSALAASSPGWRIRRSPRRAYPWRADAQSVAGPTHGGGAVRRSASAARLVQAREPQLREREHSSSVVAAALLDERVRPGRLGSTGVQCLASRVAMACLPDIQWMRVKDVAPMIVLPPLQTAYGLPRALRRWTAFAKFKNDL